MSHVKKAYNLLSIVYYIVHLNLTISAGNSLEWQAVRGGLMVDVTSYVGFPYQVQYTKIRHSLDGGRNVPGPDKR
jgi:hypothetical protein